MNAISAASYGGFLICGKKTNLQYPVPQKGIPRGGKYPTDEGKAKYIKTILSEKSRHGSSIFYLECWIFKFFGRSRKRSRRQGNYLAQRRKGTKENKTCCSLRASVSRLRRINLCARICSASSFRESKINRKCTFFFIKNVYCF